MTLPLIFRRHLYEKDESHFYITSVHAGNEAARAGEAGEGFAVVAGEIKEINEAMEQNTDVTEKLDETTKRFISL